MTTSSFKNYVRTAAASVSERTGVVRHRTEYSVTRTVPLNAPLVGIADVRRVVFLVELHGGLGPELVAVDQTLDAVSTLLAAGDQVTVRISGDVHVESTVHPNDSWGSGEFIDPAVIAAGKLKRVGLFVDTSGDVQVATLIVTKEAGPVVVLAPLQFNLKTYFAAAELLGESSGYDIIVHELGHTWF
jgi:hypothetical protein